MNQRIEQDCERFRKLVRGKIQSDLGKYIRQGEMIGRKGKDLVSIPLPQIDIPHFRFGKSGQGGVGSGSGNVGDPLGPGQPGPGDPRQAGDQPGEHILEVEMTLAELAAILGESLALPRIEPRGRKNIVAERDRYSSIRPVGPESLRHFKRTFKRALKRMIASGTYNPDDPRVVPVKQDKQYRSWKQTPLPQAVAAILFMMDVSGSMQDDLKEIVRTEAFWIDTWIRSHYRGVETVYIIHDSAAREVDENAFYHTRESGGTRISSAYELCLHIMRQRFPIEEWNVYAFHFSDGDNLGNDNARCQQLLAEQLLPRLNLFGYGQVTSDYGSGEFIEHLNVLSERFDNLVTSQIDDREGIVDSIRALLGRGL